MGPIDFAWGEQGLTHADPAEVTVIVDVLSFSTAVEAACTRGAQVYPYRWRDTRAEDFARSVRAQLAVPRAQAQDGTLSLSPLSLSRLQAKDRIVLPSPNGATLSTMAASPLILVACLRNARSVAQAVTTQLEAQGGRCLVVAAGERWPDDTLRPALEDQLGAGAVIAELGGEKSADALATQAVFEAVGRRSTRLEGLSSSLELQAIGFGADVTYAASLNVSDTVPVLNPTEGYFAADGKPRTSQIDTPTRVT